MHSHKGNSGPPWKTVSFHVQQPERTDKEAPYLPVHRVIVDVRFLGPLLPELGVIQLDVRAVLGGHEAGLGEGGAFALALNGDGGGAPLQDLVDVLLAEAAALVVLIHDGGVRTFPQQVLYLLLGELLNLL